MMKFLIISNIIFLSAITFQFNHAKAPEAEKSGIQKKINSLDDIKNLFPKTVDQINTLVDNRIQKAQEEINVIIAVPSTQLTFKNTFGMWDKAFTDMDQDTAIIRLLFKLSPDPELRQAAQDQLVILQKHTLDLFSYNKELYTTLKAYAILYASGQAHEQLTQEEHYLMNEKINEYERNGLNLPDEQRNKVVALQKELTELSTQFGRNIYDDQSTIEIATKEELAGLDDEFIENLKKTSTDSYIIKTGHSEFVKITSFCSVSETRKKMYHAYHNRAYPQNLPILNAVIEKRHELATLLGFPSFAHLSIAAQMAKTPEAVEKFLNDLIQKIEIKEALEFEQLLNDKPENISLTSDGKIYPWDKGFWIECFKNKNFNIDENEISHYFPMENIIKELLEIYSDFLDLEFQELPIDGMWHPEVKLITVSKDDKVLGYLFLDLYPRENKYNHAYQTTIIPALRLEDSFTQPAVGAVITNFTHATAHQPSLLKRVEVKTFFHEFGHALHTLLGATKLGTQSGTNVKTDFVEMPSQMLEEWLFDPTILKQISHHYQTGESLPDDIINTLISLKNLSAGCQVQQQLSYALLSLELFKEGSHKDVDALYKKTYSMSRPHDAFYDESHVYAAFGHLMDYNALYYGYLYSQVYALELFEVIKQYGLRNPEIGVQYIDKVLAPGGSADPMELIVNFLGHEPTADAFARSIGLQ